MNQKIHEITVRDILGLFIAVHKMMFQNLPAKLQQDVRTNKNPVEISSGSIAQNDEKEETEKLWAVETMKFSVIIGNGRVQSLLDSNSEVNILLYHIALVLELAI